MIEMEDVDFEKWFENFVWSNPTSREDTISLMQTAFYAGWYAANDEWAVREAGEDI